MAKFGCKNGKVDVVIADLTFQPAKGETGTERKI